MTVKRMLGAGVLAFAVTVGGFVLPPAGDRLTPSTAVVPGATPAPDIVEAGAEGVNAEDMGGEDVATSGPVNPQLGGR